MRIAVVIPVANLEGAKTRLGETLDAEERHDLVTRLLARTVETALAVDRVDDVLVVSPDREVLARTAELGARTLRQRSRGLNAGVRDGREDVVAGGADAVLVLPIDLPLATPDAVEAILQALDETPDGAGGAVVVVPDRHGTGTNALALRPPMAIDVAFGPNSRDAHRRRAGDAGATWVELPDSPLTVDLDTPEDLMLLESTAPERLRVG
jgi:2-phospho-L-lactate/phosphoenolpyruvate guanylyltransferase